MKSEPIQTELEFPVGYEVVVRLAEGVAVKDLDQDDVESLPTGEYFYNERSAEEALTSFHNEIPIAVLDDFDITCEPCFN